MAIYVGEGVTIVCAALNPVTKAVVTDATATVEFFAPGKTPAKVPADRVVDHGPFAMAFDATVANADGTTGAYLVEVDTTGWTPGKWSFRCSLADAFESWEYGTLKLDA